MGAETGKPSVLDVAKLSGVSPSTVCRVINKRHNVSEKAKEKVLEACASLGFRKNAAASMLRLRKSDLVVCLMPDNANEIFIDKISSLKWATLALGRRWRLHFYQNSEEALKLLDEIVAGRPSGAILSCPLDANARKLLDSNNIAVVCYDQSDPVYDSVVLDRAAGISVAVSHLISRGCRSMLTLGFSLEGERGKGCIKAFEAAGLPLSDLKVFNPIWDRDMFAYGHNAIGEALKTMKFDAVMAMNDACAIGAMRRLGELGIRIPDDIPVVGFDDIMVSSFTRPALSTVSQPKERMASCAVEMLAKRLANPTLPQQVMKLSTTFLKRESA